MHDGKVICIRRDSETIDNSNVISSNSMKNPIRVRKGNGEESNVVGA